MAAMSTEQRSSEHPMMQAYVERKEPVEPSLPIANLALYPQATID
jgi:hypothetical protein